MERWNDGKMERWNDGKMERRKEGKMGRCFGKLSITDNGIMGIKRMIDCLDD